MVAAPTGPFTRCGTNPPQNGRDGNALKDDAGRLRQVPGGQTAQHGRNIECSGTGGVARAEAVAVVIVQKQFQGSAPRRENLLGLAFHLHAGKRLGGARGNQAPASGNLHHAYHARCLGADTLPVAQGGDGDAQGGSGRKYRAPCRDMHFLSVNGQ